MQGSNSGGVGGSKGTESLVLIELGRNRVHSLTHGWAKGCATLKGRAARPSAPWVSRP